MFNDNSELRPILINKNIVYKFKQMMKPQIIEEDSHWESFMKGFYKSYIKPNFFALFIFLLIILFLVYKFFTKKKERPEEDFEDNEHNEHNEDNEDDGVDGGNGANGDKHDAVNFKKSTRIQGDIENQKNIVLNNSIEHENDKISNTQQNTDVYAANAEFDETFRPTFNPYYPVDFQPSYVNYLPDAMYFDVNGEYKSYNDFHPQTYSQSYMPLPNRGVNPDVFTGIDNTLYGATDPPLPDPLGEIADYNTSTEKAMQFMTSQNRKNLDLLTEIMFENPVATNTGKDSQTF